MKRTHFIFISRFLDHNVKSSGLRGGRVRFSTYMICLVGRWVLCFTHAVWRLDCLCVCSGAIQWQECVGSEWLSSLLEMIFDYRNVVRWLLLSPCCCWRWWQWLWLWWYYSFHVLVWFSINRRKGKESRGLRKEVVFFSFIIPSDVEWFSFTTPWAWRVLRWAEGFPCLI